ncbi:hypothetical protein P5G51_015600 [Virgibacillus sp. 179-BFC.A HS]|uniref:Uncharacterized protein n=1 Tax=Tigheibacillus jepli TaxID=3035914 RepID=A0ABU5CJR6_9BACI|nr:hypothetical protein [Virgibacillus sp. 179-BFC.A HS]MDY0406597.1 hypothetical protein [Virgibacillus sp. 179-BFC.A HS]
MKKIQSKDFNDVFLTEEDYSERWNYYYSKVPLLLIYSTGIVIRLYEELFDEISEDVKLINKAFILTKWISTFDHFHGENIIKNLLEDVEITLKCEECYKSTSLNDVQILDLQYNSHVECKHCGEYIRLSEYHFNDK